MPNKKKTALVLEGGGSKGAFSVGVIKYLFDEYRKTGWFSIVGGASSGALVAPLAALMGAPEPMGREVLDTLVCTYTQVSTSDILNKWNVFGVPLRLDCLNTSAPLNALLHQQLRPEWFEWLQEPKTPHCYVTYVNYQNGQKVTVSPKDEGMNREEFIRAMLASASVPVIIGATIIDGEVCYDGGIRDLLPLGKAIDLGAETIVPIFLEPEQFGETRSRFKRIDKILLRTISILLDESVRNDVNLANQINIAIRAKKDILEACQKDPTICKEVEDIFNKNQDLFGKRLVNIIDGLRPDYSLTEDALTFDPVEMRKWVDLGEQKAKEIIQENPFV